MVGNEETAFALVDEEHNVWRCEKCGHLDRFEADGPKENGWDFCPHCARRIAEEGQEDGSF